MCDIIQKILFLKGHPFHSSTCMLRLSILIPLLLCLCFPATAQNDASFCLKVYHVNILLQKNHYAPKAINNSFSEYVFDTFLQQLDSEQTIFFQQEVDSLRRYRHLLDDAIFTTDCAFMEDFRRYYKRGLERNMEAVNQLREEPFDPEPLDSLYPVVEKDNYFEDIASLKKLYRKRIAYDILDRVARSGTNQDSLYARLPVVADSLRLQQLDNYACHIESLLNPNPDMESYMADLFINVFCSYFDPHTTFLPTDSQTAFFNSISSSTLGLGLEMQLNESNGVNVAGVHPGSPAFRDQRIEEGDRLLRVRYDGAVYEVNCVNMNMVYTLFYSDQYRAVELTFRKKSGIEYQSRLKKEVLKNYDNSTYSFLIDHSITMGYVYIPSFYSSMEGYATNLYDDVLYELNHLKEEGAKGFIIDLQFNPGGDIYQALKLMSLFTEQVPAAVFKDRRLGLDLVFTPRGIKRFDEPLVIMVNGATASAGELFADVMQQRKRAVLLGQRTYGKSTMQTFYPLDDTAESELLKITFQKMFKMNGETFQRRGVTPDLITPALLEPLYLREEDAARALEPELLDVQLTENILWPRNYQNALTLGPERIANRTHYQKIAQHNEEVKRLLQASDTIPLQFDYVFEQISKEQEQSKDFQEIKEKTYAIKLRLLSKDLKKIAAGNDGMIEAVMERNKKAMHRDPDLFEAIHVLWEMF